MPPPKASRAARTTSFLLRAAIAFAVCTRVREARADEPAERPTKTEFTPAPLIGGNSDIGFGGGAILSFARVLPGSDDPLPYVYRLEFATTTTVKSEGGSIKVPYQDEYLLLSMPHLLRNKIQLDVRVSFTAESTQKYYGIGNAVFVPPDRSLDDPIYEYGRVHVAASIDGTVHITRPLSLLLWVAYVHNWLDVPPGTVLAEDVAHGDSTVRSLLTPFEPHGVVTFTYGVDFDTRDSKVSATRGMHHATRVDLSPGGTPGIPQRWGRWNTNLRAYLPIGTDGSTIALRFVSDLLFGSPPFYELARYDDTGVFGGPNGVRGVPDGRYSGMIKLFGSVELRKMLFDFRFLDKRNTLGVVAFADSGRAFTSYDSHPELDGTSLGLKLGLGAGARLLAGKSFVLRADVAWSPDARPVGVYVAAGQTF